MNVPPVLYPAIVDDPSPHAASATGGESFARALGGALDAAASELERAHTAETAFAGGNGDLQGMVVARARADVALQIATVTASRVTQSLSTILAMQI